MQGGEGWGAGVWQSRGVAERGRGMGNTGIVDSISVWQYNCVSEKQYNCVAASTKLISC